MDTQDSSAATLRCNAVSTSFRCMILQLLIFAGCATHQPRIIGRWHVSGTDNVVTLSKDHSVRFRANGDTVNGNWRMPAPDILILTVPVSPTHLEERTIIYLVPLNGQQGRSLKIFGDIPGGTLADAPFHLTLPSGGWRFENNESASISSNLTRAAYATNATELRTVVIREQLNGVSDTNLEQLAANMRSKLTTANVQVTDTKTNFVGLPARLLVYDMKIGNDRLYTETVLLAAGDTGWTISAIGPAGRKEDVHQILTFYSKK